MANPATELNRRALAAEVHRHLAGATMADAVWLWRAAGLPPPAQPIDPLVSLHQARVQFRDASPEHVKISRMWLLERGYPVPERPTVFPGGTRI